MAELRGVACHMLDGSHNVRLLATQHKRTHPALTPASKADTRFSYPGGMEGWVDLGDLIVSRPGVERDHALSWRTRDSMKYDVAGRPINPELGLDYRCYGDDKCISRPTSGRLQMNDMIWRQDGTAKTPTCLRQWLWMRIIVCSLTRHTLCSLNAVDPPTLKAWFSIASQRLHSLLYDVASLSLDPTN